MSFSNLKSRKREELPKFILAPEGSYLFMCLSAKETSSERTGSVGVVVTLRVEEIGADVDMTGVDAGQLQGKKMFTRFWIENANGEMMESAAFATEFLNAVFGEDGWEEMVDAFESLEGRLVRGYVGHRVDNSSGEPRIFADLKNFKAA